MTRARGMIASPLGQSPTQPNHQRRRFSIFLNLNLSNFTEHHSSLGPLAGGFGRCDPEKPSPFRTAHLRPRLRRRGGGEGGTPAGGGPAAAGQGRAGRPAGRRGCAGGTSRAGWGPWGPPCPAWAWPVGGKQAQRDTLKHSHTPGQSLMGKSFPSHDIS